jgi:hypothetical protein
VAAEFSFLVTAHLSAFRGLPLEMLAASEICLHIYTGLHGLHFADGVRILLVEAPTGHPLRRAPR